MLGEWVVNDCCMDRVVVMEVSVNYCNWMIFF